MISDFGSTFSGVLTDEQGRVQAIWGSFSTQVSTRTKKKKMKNKKPKVYCLIDFSDVLHRSMNLTYKFLIAVEIWLQFF